MSDLNLINNILMLKVDADNDANLQPPNDTIRDYLKALLTQLWLEKEEFSGKRPFGNSSWEYDLYKALIKANYIAGTIDDDGYLDPDCDDAAGDALITQAIEALL